VYLKEHDAVRFSYVVVTVVSVREREREGRESQSRWTYLDYSSEYSGSCALHLTHE
jgi:hypothetical protein